MKSLLIAATILVSLSASAEEAWYYDSCMENIVRQFTCVINGKDVAIDLEHPAVTWDEKTVTDRPVTGDGKELLGIILNQVAGGKLYVACDDSAKVEKALYTDAQGKETQVSCRAD